MRISKVTFHGIADTAAELERFFYRVEDQLTDDVIAAKPDSPDPEWGQLEQTNGKGHVIYRLSEMKLVPKLDQPTDDGLETYVVGHATYTRWTG